LGRARGTRWDALRLGRAPGGGPKYTLINSSFGTRSGPWDALGRAGTRWDALGRAGTRSGWDALGRAGTRSTWDALVGRAGTRSGWDALKPYITVGRAGTP
jgi:hypothetical protein